MVVHRVPWCRSADLLGGCDWRGDMLRAPNGNVLINVGMPGGGLLLRLRPDAPPAPCPPILSLSSSASRLCSGLGRPGSKSRIVVPTAPNPGSDAFHLPDLTTI